MHSNDLRVFEAVARLGTMNCAAIELNTVQSNITARIRQLEDDLRTELFVRGSRGVKLTDAGHRLLPFAREIKHLLMEARHAVHDDCEPRGTIQLGSLETTAAYRLAPVITAFSQLYPRIDISLRIGTNAEILEEVVNQRLDGAFLAGPIERPDCERVPVFKEELVIVAGRETAATRNEDVSTETGQTTVIVKGLGCYYRHRLEDHLLRRGLGFFRRIELGSIEAILSCVAAGLGVTLMPRSIVERFHDRTKLSLRDLPAEEASVTTEFVWRRNARMTTALRAFETHVRGLSIIKHPDAPSLTPAPIPGISAVFSSTFVVREPPTGT